MENLFLRRMNTVSAFLLTLAFLFSIFAVPFIVFLLLSALFMAVGWFFPAAVQPQLALKTQDILLGLFFLSVLISAALAGDKVAGLEGVLVILAYLLVYLFFKISLFPKNLYKRLVFAAAVALCFSCSFALVHYLVIKHDIVVSIGGSVLWTIEATNHNLSSLPLISILQHPAAGGNLLAFISVFVLSLLVNEYKTLKYYQRVLLFVSFLLALVTIILTQTRGSILILAAAVIVQVLFTRRYLILLALVVLGGLLFLLPNEKMKNTLLNPLSSQNMPGRFLQYEAGLDMLKHDNPVFGIGLLNFKPRFDRNYSQRPFFESVPYIHNNFEALLVETGILGFLLFYGFLGMVLFRAGKDYIFSKRTTARLTAVSLIAGFLLNSLFDSLLYVVPIGILIWIASGLAFNKSINED